MTGRKGNRKSLLSYKGRINGQPAVQKVTLYSFEPAGIGIWVFQILKHYMHKGLVEGVPDPLVPGSEYNDKWCPEVLQSTWNSQNKDEIRKD